MKPTTPALVVTRKIRLKSVNSIITTEQNDLFVKHRKIIGRSQMYFASK